MRALGQSAAEALGAGSGPQVLWMDHGPCLWRCGDELGEWVVCVSVCVEVGGFQEAVHFLQLAESPFLTVVPSLMRPPSGWSCTSCLCPRSSGNPGGGRSRGVWAGFLAEEAAEVQQDSALEQGERSVWGRGSGVVGAARCRPCSGRVAGGPGWVDKADAIDLILQTAQTWVGAEVGSD